MQAPTPFRTLDKIDGPGFMEIRVALRSLRLQQPNAMPELARVLEDGVSGTVVIFQDQQSSVGVRRGSTVLIPMAEARFLVANADPTKPQRELHGASIPLIEAAAVEFGKKLSIIPFDQYVISVADDGANLVVMFNDRNRSPSARGGGAAGRPSFEVVFDRKTGGVIRSNFVR